MRHKVPQLSQNFDICVHQAKFHAQSEVRRNFNFESLYFASVRT